MSMNLFIHSTRNSCPDFPKLWSIGAIFLILFKHHQTKTLVILLIFVIVKISYAIEILLLKIDYIDIILQKKLEW